MANRTTQTFCRICEAGCGLTVTTDSDLIGIDYVTLSGVEDEFTIDRSLIEPN